MSASSWLKSPSRGKRWEELKYQINIDKKEKMQPSRLLINFTEENFFWSEAINRETTRGFYGNTFSLEEQNLEDITMY